MNLTFRKLLFALAFMLSLSVQAFSQNERSGLIISSTTWSKEMSPIHIIGRTVVHDTVTLTIEPGVEVIFQGNYALEVRGNIVAQGTATDSVIFTKSDTIDSWKGIEIETADAANDSSLFKYARVEYVNNCGITVISTDKFGLSHCLISKNKGQYGSGVSIWSSNTYVVNNTFSYDSIDYIMGDDTRGSALYCYNSTVIIVNNLFHLNNAYKGGGLSTVESEITLFNNSFVSNQATIGGATFLFNSNCTISNNVFWNNIGSHEEAIVYLHNGSYTFKHTAFQNGVDGIFNNSATIEYDGGSFDATCIDLAPGNSQTKGPNFTDPDNHDYSLSWQSPLINSGDTAGISGILPASDKVGNPRIQRGIIDIGAYESPNINIDLIAIAGENGSITPETARVAEDSSFTFVIKPEIGYSVDSASFGGTDVLADLIADGDSLLYTIDEVTQSDTMYVGFGINTYIMRAIAGEHGAVIPDSAVAEYGSDFTYTIRVDEGYQIASASIRGADVTKTILESDYTYTVNSVTQADTLYVSFELESYSMKSSAGANGTVTPAEEMVTRYDSVVFTITPDANYEVATAVFNSQDVMESLVATETGFTYQVDSVLEAGLLEISFEEIPVSAINGQKVSQLKVFPNPSTGNIVVEGYGVESISIVNMEGRTVEQVMADKSKTSIDLSQYPGGIYFVIVKTDKGIETEKIVLE